MNEVPREAAIGFQRGAADYERGRPGYPDAAIALLARELAIEPGAVVVDLAAGTGKLTRALVGLGADVVAIEPIAGMREQLVRAVPGVKVLEGTAERMPLADGAAEAVLVAQAFHWFDVPSAAAEIHRVLAPAGGLGVIRNEWDDSVAWIGQMRALIAETAGQPPHRHAHHWRGLLEAAGLFTPLVEEVFPNPVRVDVETLLARVASLSYVAMLDDAARADLLDGVARLVGTEGLVAADGRLDTPYRTHVAWGRRRDP